jgi:UDP-glucose 4-epimerase
MKKFLVTGGAGFIGSHLVKKLVESNCQITVLDDLNTGKKSNIENLFEKINFVHGDIRDKDLVDKLSKEQDGIFHLAARASVQESFEKPKEYHDVNVVGTENIFDVGKKYGLKVVFSSSSSVYGNPESIPIKEDSSKNPINPYAVTKLEKEKLATKFSLDGLKVIGLRYLNVFGEGQSSQYAGVIKLFLERIEKKLPPKINGDGSQSRDFVFVNDVVNANILAMKSDVKYGFFNVGSGTTISVIDIAKLMLKISKLDLQPIFNPPLPGDVKITLADITEIKKQLGWQPSVFLEDWLKQKISEIMKNN